MRSTLRLSLRRRHDDSLAGLNHAAIMTKQFCYRKTCNGVVLRLRVNPDNSWLVIERPGAIEREYIDIAESDVDSVRDRFAAINDPTSFAAFVDSVSGANAC